jgi:MoxR-like ATPase
MEGTYPLPEAQRDRFMARVSMGYPAPDAELRMISGHGAGSPLTSLAPAATAADIVELIALVGRVHLSPPVAQYAVDLVNATRSSPELRLGASPRATLHLVRASRAAAALDDRDYVLPDDMQALAVPVLAHRLLPTAEAQMARRTPEQIVADLVRRVPVPGPGHGQPARVQEPARIPPAPAQAPHGGVPYPAPVSYEGRGPDGYGYPAAR